MKILITVSLFCFALTSFACPNLAGTYHQCTLKGYYPEFNMTSVQVTQARKFSGVTVYTFNAEDRDGEISKSVYRADGVPEIKYETDEGTVYKTTTNSFCSEAALINTEKVEVEELDFSLEADEAITLADNSLVITMGVEGVTVATITCTK